MIVNIYISLDMRSLAHSVANIILVVLVFTDPSYRPIPIAPFILQNPRSPAAAAVPPIHTHNHTIEVAALPCPAPPSLVNGTTLLVIAVAAAVRDATDNVCKPDEAG